MPKSRNRATAFHAQTREHTFVDESHAKACHFHFGGGGATVNGLA
jgi:hypothetical protein